MRMSTRSRISQAGFTLIELVVVIVILGILAATAIPRFLDLSGNARVAKMQAAKAALQTGSALFHAAWLTAGSPAAAAGNSTNANSVVSLENVAIAFIGGYPDVGGDGSANAATSTTNSGIVKAAGGLEDYQLSATATVLTITPDANRPSCTLTYTEGTPPTINDVNVTAANCN